MDNKNTVSLELTVEEVNTILTTLGERPYVQVFGLVQKIQQQAQTQLKKDDAE